MTQSPPSVISTPTLVEAFDFFQTSLQDLSDNQRAIGEKAYLKSQLTFWGVSTPKKRLLTKHFLKLYPGVDIDWIVSLASMLWNTQIFEMRTCGIELLKAKRNNLTNTHINFLEELIHTTNTWAELDPIAIDLIGAIAQSDTSVLLYLPVWAKSDNFWVRRAAILTQIPQFRQGKGNMQIFTDIVVPMFTEGSNWSKEERFFIRKAIGWVLREKVKSKPENVVTFVNTYKAIMSGLTYKEATRNLPFEYKSKLK